LKSSNNLAVMAFLLSGVLFANSELGTLNAQTPEVSLYKVFERSVENTKAYSNKFIDVDLKCSYTSPSGKKIDFIGFFDGDGKGGGDKSSGNVWKVRFMPDELGTWQYQWSWSDETPGGQGEFSCVSAGAGKGVLHAYAKNPRWFAYNGTEPVYLKSYYDSSMRPFSQPWDCVQNYYQALLDNGYNHLQVNWLLPTVTGINIADCSGPSTGRRGIYEEKGKASSTMQLDIWNKMEVLLSWLNDRNVNLFMFLGFDGGRNHRPQAWASLSVEEQEFFVRYVVARIAPYSIIMWNYVWEVEGDTENGELGCMRLVQKYDVFNHLRTYQDEKPKYNEFNRPEYTFAGIENHRIHSDNREPEYWDEPWTHHDACLVGYVPGKPIYMVEGNLLWRHYWAADLKKEGQNHTPDLTRQAAWGCATAAGSFTWCGHLSLSLTGSRGLPFFDSEGNPYRAAAKAIDLLNNIVTNEVVFYRMTPQDSLLSGHDNHSVWCLAEPGQQYLVFSSEGKSFSLSLTAGTYTKNLWIDTKTGAVTPQESIELISQKSVSFTPPDTETDWVLLVREPNFNVHAPEVH